jgi:hypothetical protein
MSMLLRKFLLGLLLLCLSTPELYGQATQSIFVFRDEDEELDILIERALQGDEESVTIIINNILQELDPEVGCEYIKALVLLAQAGIPSAQEMFHEISNGYSVGGYVYGTVEAFIELLPVFESIIKDRSSPDILIISAISAARSAFYLSRRSEPPLNILGEDSLNILYECLDRLKEILKDNSPDEKHSDALKMEATFVLEFLLTYVGPASFDDIFGVLKEVISDPQVFHLSRARLLTDLASIAVREDDSDRRSQIAYALIEELIPVIDEILSDEVNWSLDDLKKGALQALRVVIRRNNKHAITLLEQQIPRFKAMLSIEEKVILIEPVASVLIAACINGNQQAAECLLSLISGEAYADRVKGISIGKLAAETRNGNLYASSVLKEAYAGMCGVEDELLVPFSEFLWPNENFPYWVLRELLMNRVANSLNPESLLGDTRPLALIIFAKEGGSIISGTKRLLLPIFVKAGCRVLLYEANTDIEVCEVAEKATPMGIKADIVLIMGHGSSIGGVQLGSLSSNCHELFRLDSSDVEEMIRIGNCLANDAAVVFLSCLLGRGREDNKESVPSKFAEAAPHVGMIFSADGVLYMVNDHTLPVFEFDSEGKLIDMDFYFSNPSDDTYIIRLNNMDAKLAESAIEEKAGMKSTALGRIKSQGDPPATETMLLQNYPNPLNPETWIPFHLSQEADVSVRIYDSFGRLVRSLDLGRKSEGVYVDKSKAAYWDGRNDSGEEVASGIYYYSISAGDFSATRKMIVKK